jgi:hypothetical protein
VSVTSWAARGGSFLNILSLMLLLRNLIMIPYCRCLLGCISFWAFLSSSFSHIWKNFSHHFLKSPTTYDLCGAPVLDNLGWLMLPN